MVQLHERVKNWSGTDGGDRSKSCLGVYLLLIAQCAEYDEFCIVFSLMFANVLKTVKTLRA